MGTLIHLARAAVVAGIIVLLATLPGGAEISAVTAAGNTASVTAAVTAKPISIATKLDVKAKPPSSIPGGPFIQAQTLTQYLASDRLIGGAVHNAEGKVIGHIDDLIVSAQHEIIGVIVGIGGALGFGEKKIGISMDALEIRRVEGRIHITVNVPIASLKTAPSFKRSIPVKSLIQRGAEATRNVLKKAADKTTRTVSKAKEVTKKVVAPINDAKDQK